MAASKQFAMKQLERFASFPGTPKTLQEVQERAQYLADLSASDSQCVEITDRLMRSVRYFPLPVDMEIAAEQQDPGDWKPVDEPQCGCGGTGWISVERDGCAFAKRCTCMGKGDAYVQSG